MTKTIVINNATYYASSELARRFSYTNDYISRLARQGKVQATRVGRQWFVEPASLEQFTNDMQERKQQLGEQVRQERLHERKLRSEYPIPPAHALGSVHSVKVSQSPSVYAQFHAAFLQPSVVRAFLVAVAVLATGGLVGETIYTHFGNIGAISMPHIAAQPAAVSAVQSVAPGIIEQPASAGMIVFNETTSDDEVAAVATQFSDPVEVEFITETTGIITPQFSDGTGDKYRFLMVPVTVGEEVRE